MKTNELFKLLFMTVAFLLLSCNNDELNEHIISNVSIERIGSIEDYNLPFADTDELKSYVSQESKVVDYTLARKIALLEVRETGFVDEMKWNGFRISEKPILICDLNSTPRYYDFIALDAENIPVGTIRLYATIDNSSIIQGVYSEIFDYNAMTTKSTSANPSIFMDWKGAVFVGVKSKAGDAPTDVISVETGENVSQEDVKELEEEEIIDYMADNIFPDLMSNTEKGFENIPEELLQDSIIMSEIEMSKSVTVEILRDSMFLDLQMTKEEAEAYWNTLKENETELMNASDEELNSDSKFLGRWFRRIFNKTDNSLKYISKYDSKKYSYRRGGWCGPWACGYIVYVNQGTDKYEFFENCAGTFGELGVGNLLLRLVGRPLTPVEMSWSMPIASKGHIWINPMLCFADLYAYDQIKHYGKPALRLCSSGGGLHWTLAYGAKQTGSWFWRNYYFLQIDNGAEVGIPNSMTNSANYTKVDWWNPWLMVWD